MAIIVRVTNAQTGSDFFLKSTIWTSAKETASKFENRADAEAAFAKSQKFTKPRVFKQTFGIPKYEEN